MDNPQYRQRVIGLLNPRRKKVIELSDEAFESFYTVLTKDNYAQLSDRSVLVQIAEFDAVHGYYVAPDIRLL